MQETKKANALLALLLVAATACGGYAIPAERKTAAESAWISARTGGAEGFPPANVHLKNAEKALSQAKSLIKDGDNKRADYVLMTAKAEADLALALTKEHNATLEAEHANERVKALQK